MGCGTAASRSFGRWKHTPPPAPRGSWPPRRHPKLPPFHLCSHPQAPMKAIYGGGTGRERGGGGNWENPRPQLSGVLTVNPKASTFYMGIPKSVETEYNKETRTKNSIPRFHHSSTPPHIIPFLLYGPQLNPKTAIRRWGDYAREKNEGDILILMGPKKLEPMSYVE